MDPLQEALRRGARVVALVRHGQTAWNASRRFLGRTDVPLDAIGHAQARALAAAWPHPFDRVVSSPLSRASGTAGYLAAQHDRIDDLQELHQGELEGLHGEEALRRYADFFARWQADPTGLVVPGGESLDQCQERGMAAVEGLLAEAAPGELVGAFTHQMVIATVACRLAGEPLTAWRDHRVGNTMATLLARERDGSITLVRERWAVHDHEVTR